VTRKFIYLSSPDAYGFSKAIFFGRYKNRFSTLNKLRPL